jgi:tetratricopeptide (TPR) repeat protein
VHHRYWLTVHRIPGVRVQTNADGAALLRVLLDRLEWSPEQLARDVNRLAGEPLISIKAPYGWLRGSVPRGRTAQLAALALSKALGQTVSVGVLWPGARGGGIAVAAHHGLDLPWDADGAIQCAELVAQPTANALLAATGPMLVTCAVDWLTTPLTAPPTRASGEPLGEAAVYILRDRVAQLRRLDDTQSGPMLFEWVVRDFRWAATLAATSSYDRHTGRGLFGVLAELGQLAGWVATDLDRRALGQRFLLASLRFAHTAADHALAVNILSCLAYHVLWSGDADSAIRVIRLARQGAHSQVNGLALALLASREGRAHAVRGDFDECERALAEAACIAADDSRRENEPAWAYWISEGVLTADAGRAWLEAGRAARAAPLLSRGIELLGATQPRNRALHSLSLTQAHLQTGRFDAAAEAGERALELFPPASSPRVHARLAEVALELERRLSPETDRLAHHVLHVLNP